MDIEARLNNIEQLLLKMNNNYSDSVKQMSLTKFCKAYGICRTTALMLINRADSYNPLPAYKIKGQWYVDLKAYEKWRVVEDRRERKW